MRRYISIFTFLLSLFAAQRVMASVYDVYVVSTLSCKIYYESQNKTIDFEDPGTDSAWYYSEAFTRWGKVNSFVLYDEKILRVETADKAEFKGWFTVEGDVLSVDDPPVDRATKLITADREISGETARANAGGWKRANNADPVPFIVAKYVPAQVEKPSVTTSFTYDGTPKTCASAASHYTVTGNTETNAGDYTFTAKLESGYMWSDGTSADYVVAWKINKKTISTDSIVFSDRRTVYAGEAQAVTASSVPDGVTVTYSDNSRTDVGEQTATANFAATDSANCQVTTASKTAKLTITAATITGVTLAPTSITYDGNPHQPAVASVTANGKTFSSSDTGWTVVYQRNGVVTSDFTNAGTITVRVTGTGNLTGWYTAYFTIGTKEIRMDEVVFDDLTVTYDGTEKAIRASNVPSGVTASYSSSTRTTAGEQQARVTFEPNDPNHTVSLKQKLATLKIEQAAITAIALDGTSATYDGQSHKPAIGWVTANNKTFSNSNTGWDVTYLRGDAATGDFTSPGTITVKATGTSNLKGVASATFTINPATIESATLSTGSATYDGQPHQPAVASVTANGRSFSSASTGWTVAYTRGGAATTDFTSAGTITVTVTGKTGLSGAASATFIINKATISAIALREASATYDGQPHQPAVASVTANGKTFTDAAIGWDVTYDKDDFTSVGNIRVTATGKSNLTGSANAMFAIGSKSITVTFDSNGGNAPSPASKTVQYPGTYGTLATCTRKGYDLKGWWTAKEGGTEITETTTVEQTASQTLYARWEAKKYTLTIALKEGESYGGYKGPQNYQLPDPLIFGETNLNEIAVAYKKDDADFQGYFTSAGAMVYDAQGRNVKGALGEYWTNNYPIGTYCYDGNLTLDAHFGDPKEHYQVTVAASPEEAGTVDPSGTGTYVEGSNIVLTATANTGYSFWHWTKGGAEVSTEKEYPITVTADATYTAVFTGNVVKVSFDVSEYGGTPSFSSKMVTYGQPYGELPTVTYSGLFVDAGWLDDNDNPITSSTTVTTTAKRQTLYAAEPTTRNPVVTFIDPSNANPTKKVEAVNGHVDAPIWNRFGYSLSGWEPAVPTTVTADMTVNAKWTSIADVLDCTNLIFNVGVRAHWEVCRDDFVVGDSCMRLVFSEGNDHLSTTIPGPGTLSFNWKVGNGNLYASTNGNKDIWFKVEGQKWAKAEKEELVFPGPCDLTFYSQAKGPVSCLIDNVTWTPKGEEEKYTLTVESGGNGTVAKEPNQTEYVEGTTVTISATPSDGYAFERWSDGSTVNPRQIVVASNATYVATFAALPPDEYTLEVLSGGHGTVAKDPNQTKYVEDTPVTITATPGAGYAFEKWSDGVTESPRQIVVTSNAVYTATFTNCSYVVTFDADGGTASENEKVVKYGEAYGNLPTAEKSGGIFIGWFLGDAEIKPETPVSTAHDHTLVAKWKQDMGEVSAALDCNNLAFEKTGGWTIENDHDFAYTEKGGNGLYLKTTSVDAGSGIFATVRESGTLTFHWRALGDKWDESELEIRMNNSQTIASMGQGSQDSGWEEKSVRIEVGDEPVSASFVCTDLAESGYCAIDFVTWKPDKEPFMGQYTIRFKVPDELEKPGDMNCVTGKVYNLPDLPSEYKWLRTDTERLYDGGVLVFDLIEAPELTLEAVKVP